MHNKKLLRSYMREHCEHRPQLDKEPPLSPSQRSMSSNQSAFSEVGFRTFRQPNFSDDSSSVQSTPASRTLQRIANAQEMLTKSRNDAPAKNNYADHADQNTFKKKMLQIIERSESNFHVKLQERDSCGDQYQEKYTNLEQMFIQTQSKLAQASAQLRFMAMRQAEHTVQIKHQLQQIESLQSTVNQKNQELGNYKSQLEALTHYQGSLPDRSRFEQNSVDSQLNIQKYQEFIASLERELQRKDFIIQKLEKQCQERLVIQEQEEYKSMSNSSSKLLIKMTDEGKLQRVRSKLATKQQECNSLALKLCEARGMYEQVIKLKDSCNSEELKILKEQNQKINDQIQGLREEKEAMRRQIEQLQIQYVTITSQKQKSCEEFRQKYQCLQNALTEERALNKQILFTRDEIQNLILQKDKEIKQIHQYCSKLEDMIDQAEVKEEKIPIILCSSQVQTDQQSFILLMSPDPSQIKELISGIAQAESQTDNQQSSEVINNSQQPQKCMSQSTTQTQVLTSVVPNPQSYQQVQSKILHRLKIPKGQLLRQETPKHIGKKILDSTLIAMTVIFLVMGMMGITL